MTNNTSRNRKILIVSYYWLPHSGTGTYRISKFVKYLVRQGWEPIILTASESTGGFTDTHAEPELNNCTVHRTPILEPTQLLSPGNSKTSTPVNPTIFYGKNRSIWVKLAAWVRLNFFIPDAKVFWQLSAVKEGKRIIDQEQPAMLFSTAPPPTTQLVARKLATYGDLPWIADFRDPWTKIYYYEDHPLNSLADALNHRLEKKVLAQADWITLVADNMFPHRNIDDKSSLLPNGFDRDDEQFINRHNQANDLFTIRYAGSLKMNQYPEVFINALQKLTRIHPDIADNILIEFYGNADTSIANELQQDDIRATVKFKSFIPRNQLLQKLYDADLLFMLIGRGKHSKPAVSTKIFEYMLVGKPVLGIGHTDGKAAEVVQNTGIGQFFDHEDTEGVYTYLLDQYNLWKQGKQAFQLNREAINAYDFKQLTQRLSAQMNTLIQSSG